MLRGIRLSADELHSINLVDIGYRRNPVPATLPPTPPVVGDFSIEEMQDIEHDIFGEEIL